MRLRSISVCPTLALTAVLATACANPWATTKEGYVASGDRFVAAGQHSAAILEYRNAIQLDAQYAPASLKLAEAYEETNQIAKAVSEYERAADLMPDETDVQIKTGRYLMLVGRYQDARARADVVLAGNPGHVEARLMRALAQAHLGQTDAAREEIAEASRLEPANARPYIVLAALEMNAKRTVQAEAAIRRAVQLQPNSAEAHLALANLLTALARMNEAVQSARRVTELDPQMAAGWQLLADAYMATRQSPSAEEPLKRVAAIERTAAAKFALADYYVREGRSGDAAAVLQAAAKSEDAWADASTRLARLEHATSKSPEALRVIDEVLKKYPNHVNALITKARILLDGRQTDEAAAYARRAVAAATDSVPAHALLADVLEARGDIDGAIAAANEVLKRNASATLAKVQLIRLQLRRGNAEAALQFAEDARKDTPRDATVRLLHARALAAVNRLEPAERELQALIGDVPNYSDAHAELASVRLAANRLAAAQHAAQRALELNPDALKALRVRVAADLARGDTTRVSQVVDERVAASPKSPAILQFAADTYLAMRDLPNHEAMLRRLIDVDPTNLDAYVGLATSFIRQGKLEDARREFVAISERAPSSVAAATMVGVLFEAQNRPDEAQKVYERVVASTTDAPLAANNLAWIYAERGGDLDVALQLAQAAKQRLPDAPQVNDTLGWIYYKKDLPMLAIPAFQATVAANPSNPVYWLHLGLASAKAGDAAKARQALDRALAIKPGYADAIEVLRTLPRG